MSDSTIVVAATIALVSRDQVKWLTETIEKCKRKTYVYDRNGQQRIKEMQIKRSGKEETETDKKIKNKKTNTKSIVNLWASERGENRRARKQQKWICFRVLLNGSSTHLFTSFAAKTTTAKLLEPRFEVWGDERSQKFEIKIDFVCYFLNSSGFFMVANINK